MCTRSSSNLPGESPPNLSSSNPKHRNHRRSKQPFILEESPVDTMADQHTMAELLRALTEGYAEEIVVPLILAEQFELKHRLINMMTSDQFLGLEKDTPHNHILNQQTSAVTTTMTAILKQFQATPPPASVKAIKEICVTYGGAHPYYQCLVTDGNTFPELRDNIQGYVSAAAGSSSPQYPLPSRMHKQKQQEKDEVQIHKFWQMFKQLHINITLADALTLIPKYQKMLKALLSNKEKLLELANTPLNENCSAVILKKLPEKLGDLGKFLILYCFSELKCKALADLELQEMSSFRLASLHSQLIFSLLIMRADFVIVDYESDPRVPLILGRPFLRTARALIDVHGEKMILQSINMINIFNDLSEDFLENLFATNHQSGNPTFSSHLALTSPEVKDDILDPEGGNVLIEKVINLDSTKDLPPPHNVNPLSGSTTSSSSPNHLLEEFVDELALITFLPRNDDLPFDIRSDLKEMEYFLNNDPIEEMDSILEDSVDEDNLADLNDNLADTMPEMFIDEHAFDYSSHPLYDEYDNDLFEVESDTEYVYDDPFDSKREKIKESKLLIDELDLPRSSDFRPSPKYGSFLFEDFSKVDALPLTDNKDKVFNPGILIQENLFEVNTRVAPNKNVKKIAISHASLILEDFDPPLHEPPFLKEVLGFKTLLSFSFKNEEKVFRPEILTSKGVHSSFLPEISHQGHKVFKIIKILESPMEIFPCFCGEDIRILDVPCLHFYPP
uniref:Reverse transcriptase domain-containing protein n=1 Tax=Tanacetum cinerariifolium TaxID=118510 RepID=A0A6L2MVW1_TANCI|nr:hypothetical protein [Tanacetum cinerariifolium]